jgi:RNAse (barnase) inhibitor barstar
LTKSKKKLSETFKPTKGFSENESKQIESLWDRLPNDVKDVIHLYHHGQYDSHMAKVCQVELIEKGIRNKLSGVKPTKELKRWAVGMLAYWNTVLFGLDLFKSKEAYGRAKLRVNR